MSATLPRNPLLGFLLMAGKKQTSDPRTESTRLAIIESAESLFADVGIDGVSLRQIGSAAGSSNSGVVAYHFGDKAGLLDAIFHYRLPTIDQRRGALLGEAERSGVAVTICSLMHALWMPLFEQVNSAGSHSYARFMGALIRSNWGGRRMQMNASYPNTMQLSSKIKAAMPVETTSMFDSRMNMSAIMITGVLQLIDQAVADLNLPVQKQQALFEDALSMSAAAFMAPKDN